MIFFAGNLVGVLASGFVGDHLGRKHCYCIFITLWIIFGAMGPYVDNLWIWTFTRFMIGFTSLGYNNILAVYHVELSSGKYRSFIGHIFGELTWNIGFVALGGLAYGVPNLYTMELVMALEEEFGQEIPDEDAEKLQSVGDVIKHIEESKGE